MPQRRYYGRYGDIGSEYLGNQEEIQYDPYSKWGNVGITIRDVINRIVNKRKEEQEKLKKEAQEKWAQTIEERKLAADELRARAYAEGIVNKPVVESRQTNFDKKKAILDGLLERGEINQEQYNYAVADIPMKTTPKLTIAKQPTAAKPRISETPQYKQASYIKTILGKLNSERNRLITAAGKLDPNTPDGKDAVWRIRNLGFAIDKLSHQLGQLATGEVLPDIEFSKSVAIGSDLEGVKTKPEFWGTTNIQSTETPSMMKTIKEIDIPPGTEIKRLPTGKEAVRINGIVYEVIK